MPEVTENTTNGKVLEPFEIPLQARTATSNQMEAVLDQIRSMAKAKGYKVDESPINVYLGTKKVYSQQPGQLPQERSNLTPEQLDTLHKALNNPQDVKGTVKISIGNQEVYKVQNGEVKTDHLGLSQKQQPEVQTTQTVEEQLAEKKEKVKSPKIASQPVAESHPAPEATEVQPPPAQENAASKAVETEPKTPTPVAASSPTAPSQPQQPELGSLEEKVALLESQVGHLQSQLQAMQQEKAYAFSTQPSATQARGQSVFNWLHQTQNKIVDATRELIERVKENSRELTAEAVTGGISAAVKAVGERLPDGTRVLESDKLSPDHRFTVTPDNKLLVNPKPQASPEQRWQQYSQGVDTGHRFVDAEMAARKAMRDGQTKSDVKEMLRASPSYQEFAKQDPKKAENFADTIIQSAAYKEKKLEQLQQKQQQQTTKQLPSQEQQATQHHSRQL